MFNSVFSRSKPHSYVGVLGDSGPHAPPLLRQIAQFLVNAGDVVTVQQDDAGQVDHVLHETSDAVFHFVGLVGVDDFVRRIISGEPAFKGAIIMVPPEGSADSRAQHFRQLCRHSGITAVVEVHLNDSYDVPEIISRAETLVAQSAPEADAGFLMKIHDFTHTKDLVPVVSGVVHQGQISSGETVELVDSEGIQLATVQQISSGFLELAQAQAPETVSLHLAGILAAHIRPGHIVVKPDKLKLTKAVEITGYLPVDDQATTLELVRGETQIYLHFPHASVFGRIAEELSADEQGSDEQQSPVRLIPGETFSFVVQLASLVPLPDEAVCALEFSVESLAVGTAHPLEETNESVDLRALTAQLDAEEAFRGIASFQFPEPLLTEQPASAFELRSAEEPELDEAVTYKLWYGTNRLPENPEDHSEGFTNDIGPEMLHTGTCLVNIPKTHQFGSTGSPWWKRLLNGNRDHPLELKEISAFATGDVFAAALAEALQDREMYQENRALVYLHGYNNSFEDAAIRAAQIGFDLKYPGATAFYSWPSHNQTVAYPADTQRAVASEPCLIEFLQRIQQQAGAERVDLIIHSMGNQVFARSVQLMLCAAETRGIRLGAVILAAPDIDVHLFRQIAPRYRDAADHVTMYVSLKDVPLIFSRGLQLSHRAGFGLPITVIPKISTIEVSRIDFSLFGHGYYAEAHAVLEDMMELLADQNPDNPSLRKNLRAMKTPAGEQYWEFTA